MLNTINLAQTFQKVLALAIFASTIFIPTSSVNAAGCFPNPATEWYTSSATTNAPVSQATITFTNGNSFLMQAIKGTDNKVYSRFNSTLPEGNYIWENWMEGSGITVKEEPELIEFYQGTVPYFLMSAYGTDNGIYVRKSSDGANWNLWKRGGDITLKARPVTTYLSTGSFAASPILVQSGFGSDNGLYTRTSTDGVTWTNWARGGNITLASKPEQVFWNSKLIQFARGTDNGLYSRYTADGTTWSTWARNSGGITVLDETSTTGFDFGASNVKLQQVVRGTNNGVYFRNSADGLSWSNWARLGNLTAAEKPFINTAPNAGCGGAYVMRLFAKGTDSRLYSAENPGTDSLDFGFSIFLNWSGDTAITLGNNLVETRYSPTTGFYSTIQTVRGSDNKVYLRIVNNPL